MIFLFLPDFLFDSVDCQLNKVYFWDLTICIKLKKNKILIEANGTRLMRFLSYCAPLVDEGKI